MKSKYYIVYLLVFLSIFCLVSCEEAAVSISTTIKPTIVGTVSVPSSFNIKAEDIYVKAIDEGGNTVTVRKVHSNGSFEINNLNPNKTYSIMFTSIEPDYVNRAITDIVVDENGVGAWINDVQPNEEGITDIGSVKLKKLGTIKGKALIDNKTEHYDITVYIPGTSFIAKTDKDGFFSISNLPEGSYTLRYTLDKYLPVMVENVDLVCLDEDDNPEKVVSDVVLISNIGVVDGFAVIDGEDDNTGIAIKLESEDKNKSYTTVTSKDGYYKFDSVEPGKYKVIASKTGFISFNSDFYSVEPATTTTIGEQITLFKNVGFIEGNAVFSGYNEDNSGISISFVGEENTYTTITDKTGSFKKTLKPGEYRITASYPGYTSQSIDISVIENVTVKAQIPELRPSSGVVMGFVFLNGVDDYSGVTITLTSMESATTSITEVSAKDGSFRFSGIKKGGKYILHYSKDGFVSNGSNTVDVTIGSVAVAKNVTLNSTQATLKGKVELEGASTFENVTVLLKNEKNQYTATTDQRGEYIINRILPGTYTLLASKDGYVTAQSKDFVIEPSVDKTFDTVVLSVAIRSVIGSVELENTTDYAGVLITATNIADEKLVYSAITNTSGNYTLAGMKPGEYRIVISNLGYRTETLETINIVSSTTTRIEEKKLLINRGTISGTVTLEGRSSSEGVIVELLRGDEVYESRVTKKGGDYSFYVPQGNYSGVRYSLTDFATSSVSESIALFADNFVSMGNTVLKATHNTVTGKVDVLTVEDESGVIVSFDSVDTISPLVTTRDGIFTFNNVELGNYVMRFKRKDCSDITIPVEVKAADVINLGEVAITPNTATVKGKVVLRDGLSSSGITVSIDLGGGKVLETTTDSSGRYEIGGVSIAGEYDISYSKEGWKTAKQKITPKLNLIEVREMDEIELVDETKPILRSITINNGNNTTGNRNVTITIDAEDKGSGLKTIMVWDGNNTPINSEYMASVDWTFESLNGKKTVYAKVLDRVGHESDVVSAQITLTDQKTEVKGVLKDDYLTWTKDLSPYYVTSNIMVEKGDTLNIEAGIDVQFAGDFYIQVEGAIKANGTESERIKFYGVDSGLNNWNGINVINNNGSSISYSTITGLTNGIAGYCDIDNTEIKSNYYAIGGYVSYSELPLKGIIKDCDIEGNVSIQEGTVKDCDIEGSVATKESILLDNKISGQISIESSNIDGNTITGSSLSTNGSLLINNKISSKKVSSYNDIIRYVTYDGCNISVGVNYGTHPSSIYTTQFNNCTFTELSSDVNNSNFNNCGVIKTTVSRTDREKFDCTGNYWGDINTAEMKSKGEGKDLSFITDYYDDFNKSRIDYSNYKETAISDIGYKEGYGRSGSTATYAIGDTGPAGGLIFYDKGYYSDGWRYLEAAPSDIGRYIFGYYRPEGDGLKEIGGTSTVIGSGEYNTKRLVKYMDIDGKAYDRENGDTTSEYAAKKCLDCTYGGKDDWFLPSINELDLMYENLHKKGLGAFGSYYYWSGSEGNYSGAWYQGFDNGGQSNSSRKYGGYVRAIRAF